MRVKQTFPQTDQSSKKIRSCSMTDISSLVKTPPSAGRKSPRVQKLNTKNSKDSPQQVKPSRSCFAQHRSSLTPSGSLSTLSRYSLTPPHIKKEPRSAPVQEHDPRSAPVQESNPRSAPVQESDSRSAPVQESDSSSAPVLESNPRSAAVQERDPRSAPVQESDQKTAPVQESDPRSTPVQENASVQGIVSKSTTVQGSNPKSASVQENDSKFAPVQGSGPRPSPSQRSKPRSAPVQEKDQRSTPVQGDDPQSASHKKNNQSSAIAKSGNQRSAPLQSKCSYSNIPPCKGVKPELVSKPRKGLKYQSSVLLARRVRSLLLRTSSSDSTPSPPRRRVRSYRTRRYRNRLWLYRMLAVQRRQMRIIREAEEAMAKAAESPAGTPEFLSNISSIYQLKKRKRNSPTSQSPPEIKKPSRKTSRRLWRRQLDSSSSDSPVSQHRTNATPVCVSASGSGSQGDLNTPDSTQAKIHAAAGESVNTPDQERKNFPKTVTFSEKKSVATNCTLLDFNFLDVDSNIIKTTRKSPAGILKIVKFSDSSSPGSPYIACMQVSDSKKRHPSTPHVCKSNKVARCPKSSAATKEKMQCKNTRGVKVTGKSAADKSDVTTKAPSSAETASRMIPFPNLFPRSSKKGRQITSPTETRLGVHPQAQAKTQTTKKFEKYPASLTSTQTHFRKPDTPRPKRCPETPKWNKPPELKTTFQDEFGQKCSFQTSMISLPVESPGSKHLITLSPEQSSSPSINRFTGELLQESGLDNNSGNTEQRGSAEALGTPSIPVPSGVQGAAPREMVEPQTHSTQGTPESPYISNQVINQAMISAMSFLLGVQSEPNSISITCSRPDTSNIDGRTQRENLSGCQYYAVSIKPLDLQPSQNQETSQSVKSRSIWPVQGGDHPSLRSKQQLNSALTKQAKGRQPSYAVI